VALVSLFHDQFWRHVRSGSQDRFEEATAVTTLDWCREAEICESNVEIAVEHDVLGLQVTMGDTLYVHVVAHLQHLLEVVAANLNRERLQSNEIEKFTASNELKGHVGDRDLSTIRLGLNSVFFEVQQFNHVGMVKILVDFGLILEGLDGFSTILWVGLVEDF